MNLRKLLLAASCIMLLAATAIAADPVKVESGLVEGTSENGLTVYRGIPFAAVCCQKSVCLELTHPEQGNSEKSNR